PRSGADRSGFTRPAPDPSLRSQPLCPESAREDPLLERAQLLGAPLGSMILPPAFVHSSAPLMLTNPLPLQAFLPLHEFSALAQAPWPLHALTPPQCTSPPAFSAARATTAPLSRRLAAALAISMPLRHPFMVPP